MYTPIRTSGQSSITTTERYQMIGFFIFLAVFGFASFIATQTYLGMFFIAFIVTIVLYPVYEWLVKKLRIKIIASFLTMVFFIIILIFPLSIIGIIALNEGITLFTELTKDILSTNPDSQTISTLTEKFFPSISNIIDLGALDLQKIFFDIITSILSAISSFAMYIATHSAILLINFGIFLLFLTFFFPKKNRILETIKKTMPLTDDESDSFIERLTAITKKLSVSIVIVPIIQGALMWLIFEILNIPGAVFWAVITGIVSLIPAIGVSLIWIPTTIFFALQGNWTSAIIILLYGLIIMNFSDNVIRAWLLRGKQTQVPELITLLSAIGGLFAFGFFGIFYGPLIVITFLSLLDIYKERLQKKH